MSTPRRRIHRLAANLEWLFTEAGDTTAARVRAAAAHGFRAVEIWRWRDKDIPALDRALQDTGVLLLSLLVDPQLDLTDPSTHDQYVAAVGESLEVAQRLRCPNLVAAAGAALDGRTHQEQHRAVVTALTRAAELLVGSGVTLLLEPLNSTTDHVGTFLDTSSEGMQIIREVGSPQVKLLFDAYHSLVMGEDTRNELQGAIDLVGHVQIADVPGRGEPGTGTVDWNDQLALIDDLGYRGWYGLEYRPSGSTVASLAEIEAIASRFDGTTGDHSVRRKT